MIQSAALSFILWMTILMGAPLLAQNKQTTYLFIGTYTEGLPDNGIYIYKFNTKNGRLKKAGNGHELTNPSWISISPNGKYLYACTESKMPNNGNISVFSIDSVKGGIKFLGKESSGGENPVYIAVHSSGKMLLCANYTGSTVSSFSVNTNGTLYTAPEVISLSGQGKLKDRQEKSHPHAAVFSPDEKFVVVPDLGADRIRVFKHENFSLQAIDSLNVSTEAGSGPRHFTFHPHGRFAYCIEELSGTISAYQWSDGKLDSIQRIFSYSRKSDEYAGADIHISPDGLFLYASNRMETENTIAIFSIDSLSGRLSLLGHQLVFGSHPRNFVMDAEGKFLLVANAGSNNVVVFKRNRKTGLLRLLKKELIVPRPSCLQLRSYGKS